MRSVSRLLIVALWLAVPGGARAVPVSVSVSMCRGCAAEVSAVRVMLEASRGTTGLEPRSQMVQVPGSATFDVPAGRAWEVSATAAGLWSRPVVVEPSEPSGSTAHLVLWPAGSIRGDLRGAPGQILPKTLLARFQPTPGTAEERMPEASTTCTTSATRFRCELPAGAFDLRLRARGFITQYRWGAKIPRHGSLDIGTVELKPGASIVGWVQVPGREKLEECEVEIAPQAAGSAASLTDEARRHWLRQVRVSARGFFEIDGVTPGSYRLTVRHPRLAPATVGPIGVQSGAETEVDPIPLRLPAELEVRIHPASDPYGSRWTATLVREGSTPGSSDEVAHGTASGEGVWRAASLSPGSYTLRVTGSHNARWADEPVEVVNAMPPVDVELSVLQVEGEIRLGKEPLEALIWFGGEHGARRIAARSDKEGRFSALLPRQEEGWYVEVYNAPRAITARFFDVAIRKSEGQRMARVSFEVPDTLVQGRVVDENDRPVSNAYVDAFGSKGGLDHAATRSSDEKSVEPGHFAFRGLRPGDWRIVADASGGDQGLAADSVRVETAEGRQADGLRLVLRRRIALSGEVVDPSGQPIAGADVIGLPELASGPYVGWQPHATTDSTGTFTLRLPDNTTGVELTVLAPGFALRQLRVDPHATEPLVLPVDQVAGSLVLLYPDALEKGDPPPVVRRLLTTVFHDDRIPTDLTNWAYLQGIAQTDPGRFVIPLLEPGHYTACRQTEAASPGSEVASALAGSCASGDLSPYGELVLQLPKPEAAKTERLGEALK